MGACDAAAKFDENGNVEYFNVNDVFHHRFPRSERLGDSSLWKVQWVRADLGDMHVSSITDPNVQRKHQYVTQLKSVLKKENFIVNGHELESHTSQMVQLAIDAAVAKHTTEVAAKIKKIIMTNLKDDNYMRYTVFEKDLSLLDGGKFPKRRVSYQVGEGPDGQVSLRFLNQRWLVDLSLLAEFLDLFDINRDCY